MGVLGAFYALPFWLPVIASSFNLIMLAVAYICLFIQQNREDFLGDFVNRDTKGYIWNLAMLMAIIVVLFGAMVKISAMLKTIR